jgi:alkylmercury lyase
MTDRERLLMLLATDKTTDEHALCRAAFDAILDGKPADLVRLAAATGFPSERLGPLLDGLKGRGLVVVDARGDRVIGSWGLSSAPTDHALNIRKRGLYTWCAVDAIGIPAALGEDARVSSTCHHCRSPIGIKMIGGQVNHVEPKDVRVWVTGGQVGRSVVGFT